MSKQLFSNYFSEGKIVAIGLGAFFAPIIDSIYGSGRLIPVALLLCVIILDWVTGIAVAHKDKIYSSEYGKFGIFRTFFLMALPAFANLLDSMLGMPGLFFYAITLGLIYHTWQSLTANAYRAGWGKWIPNSVIEHIDSELKAKMERSIKRGASTETKTEFNEELGNHDTTEKGKINNV
ncbi:phage holin family protein [Paenibacillus luteus]|uniref:phage holin family protein n=1 Tax=Paenibacillus luteus TaxID=2545753 RepID=UPI001143E5F6|nr:phage holin family protein [Paenibacillus luteus]